MNVFLLDTFTKSVSLYSLPMELLYILIPLASALGYNALRAFLTSAPKTYESPLALFRKVHIVRFCGCPCVCPPLIEKVTAACAVSHSPNFLE